MSIGSIKLGKKESDMAVVNTEESPYLCWCSQIYQVLKFLPIFEYISYVALEGWGDSPPYGALRLLGSMTEQSKEVKKKKKSKRIWLGTDRESKSENNKKKTFPQFIVLEREAKTRGKSIYKTDLL